MIAVLIISGFVAVGLLIGFIATSAAPVGFQDASGFHYGTDAAQADEEFAAGAHQPQMA